MGTIQVSNLGKAYKQYPSRWARLAEWAIPFAKQQHQLHWVLQDINFNVASGEAVGIIGINGAGKSTLLKMIVGTTLPTTGTVALEGRVAALLELGMGFHQDFTGRQNVQIAGQLLGLSGHEITQLIPEIEAFAEIGEYIDQPVRVYSSGMQVRLAFSVATAVRPDILIVDEALAVGDIFFQQKCFDRIREFREQGTTLLFVSHAMESVYSLCDRALLIEAGKLVLDDKPKAVIDLYNARMIRNASFNKEELKVSDQPVNTESITSKTDIEAGKAENLKSTLTAPSPDIGSYTTQGVVIESVSLYVNDQIVESFISESMITIQINVVFRSSYSDPHVGFQIRNSRGEAIFMTTTYAMKLNIGQVHEGSVVKVRFSFKAALAEGEYTITTGVADGGVMNSNFKKALARTQNASSFVVLKNIEGIGWTGVCNLMPVCKIDKSCVDIDAA